MLQQISIYLLKVISISGLLFLYYMIALRNKKFHYYNRFYLLMAVTLGIVLPFVQLEWFTFFSGSEQTIHLYKIIYGSGENDVVVNGTATINWQEIVLYASAIISILSVVILLRRIIKINKLKRLYPVQKLLEFDFVNTDISSAPFSFLKSIFWRNDINLTDETGKQILQHEITHIQQKHSWDKLYMQIVLCFFWMNPFYYFIKKELYLIHEFIADENAVKHSDADAFAKMLLTAQFGKFNFLPAQSIFYSSIKRRLIMLTTSKKPHLSYMRRVMVLPLIASLVCLFAFTVKTRNDEHKLPAIALSKPFVLVVDAGHGGKDFGAQANGLYEKNATLKIAQKIKDLSSQYGVDVVLTRNTDVFMDPRQKSDFANNQNANAFISIHINSAGKNEVPDKSGMEVYVSERNKNILEQSQVLGSAILQNMHTDFKSAPTLNTRNVGIWVVDNSNIPAALIECGYMNNNSDLSNLKDDAKIELMAKNILQGVAAYANNSFDKSNMYQLKNENDTTTVQFRENAVELPAKQVNFPADSITINASKIVLNSNAKPLFVLDGKIISEAEMKSLNPNTIESINVLKDKSATDKYGDKGKYGAVEIQLKKTGTEMKNVPDNVLYVLDGKVISKDEFLGIDKNAIESVNVLKDKPATNKYGDKGKYGVIEITSKKNNVSANLKLNNNSDTSPSRLELAQAEQEPKFPGGNEAWRHYLEQNLNASVPAKNNAPKGTYTVTVSFLVDAKGKVSEVKALNDPGYGTATEAERVIAKGPYWIPAEQNGRTVVYRQKQNISFMIN